MATLMLMPSEGIHGLMNENVSAPVLSNRNTMKSVTTNSISDPANAISFALAGRNANISNAVPSGHNIKKRVIMLNFHPYCGKRQKYNDADDHDKYVETDTSGLNPP